MQDLCASGGKGAAAGKSVVGATLSPEWVPAKVRNPPTFAVRPCWPHLRFRGAAQFDCVTKKGADPPVRSWPETNGRLGIPEQTLRVLDPERRRPGASFGREASKPNQLPEFCRRSKSEVAGEAREMRG